LPLAGLKLAYVKTAFDPPPPAAPAAGAPGRAGGAPGGAPGGGRGGVSVEDRRKIYQDVLATYRKLGANLIELDALPDLSVAQTISFILTTESAASFDDLTRSGDADQLRTGVSRSTWPR